MKTKTAPVATGSHNVLYQVLTDAEIQPVLFAGYLYRKLNNITAKPRTLREALDFKMQEIQAERVFLLLTL
jgi:hypothetical protein